jgi:hypothetical protein
MTQNLYYSVKVVPTSHNVGHSYLSYLLITVHYGHVPVAITVVYRHQPRARAPIDGVKLVADTGKADDYRYYLRVVEWCFYDPHMQER